MTLYNKDGSIYMLQKPNPIMNNQNLWSEGIKLHNMNWDSEKSEDNSTINPIQSDFEVPDSFISSLEKTKPEITVIEKQSVEISNERKSVVREDKVHIEQKNSIEKTFIHCLPATIRDRVDDLYGDSYKTIQYGKPTSFEGVILQQQDLMIQIWTDIEISKGSVLYPKINSKSWWRVQKSEPMKGGWLLTGIISDYQPSFT